MLILRVILELMDLEIYLEAGHQAELLMVDLVEQGTVLLEKFMEALLDHLILVLDV